MIHKCLKSFVSELSYWSYGECEDLFVFNKLFLNGFLPHFPILRILTVE